MSHVFGRSLEVPFSPTINGEPVIGYSLTSARLYSDSPTEGQKENTETGHVEEVSEWSVVDDTARKLTFSAVIDPDLHDTTTYETYWVVVTFKFEDGGPDVFTTEAIHVFRPDAVMSRVSVTWEDLLKHQHKLFDLFEHPEAALSGHIVEAKKAVDRKLAGMGYEKRRLFALEELNDAVKFKALAGCCWDIGAAGDANYWFDLGARYDEEFQDVLSLTRPRYDKDDDGEPEPNEGHRVNAIRLVR